MPIFDFTNQAFTEKNQRLLYYVMSGSFYGIYYYSAIDPHSMYLTASSLLSFFFSITFMNYQMTMQLSVADAALKADGEMVHVTLYNGQTYDVAVKDLKWLKSNKDKVVVDSLDEHGR